MDQITALLDFSVLDPLNVEHHAHTLSRSERGGFLVCFRVPDCAEHLPHEGNVEQNFSLGGRLSDPNMNPGFLAALVCRRKP